MISFSSKAKTLALAMAALSTMAGSSVYAASADVDLSNETLRGQFNISDTNAELGISVGALLTDDAGEVAFLTVRTQGVLGGQPNIRGGFGGRAYYANPEEGDSFQALGIGGYLDVTIPRAPDFSVGVELYYAPSITVTDDLDNFSEIAFRGSYQLFENAAAYVGVRYMETEFGNNDIEITDDLHIGFSLQF